MQSGEGFGAADAWVGGRAPPDVQRASGDVSTSPAGWEAPVEAAVGGCTTSGGVGGQAGDPAPRSCRGVGSVGRKRGGALRCAIGAGHHRGWIFPHPGDRKERPWILPESPFERTALCAVAPDGQLTLVETRSTRMARKADAVAGFGRRRLDRAGFGYRRRCLQRQDRRRDVGCLLDELTARLRIGPGRLIAHDQSCQR